MSVSVLQSFIYVVLLKSFIVYITLLKVKPFSNPITWVHNVSTRVHYQGQYIVTARVGRHVDGTHHAPQIYLPFPPYWTSTDTASSTSEAVGDTSVTSRSLSHQSLSDQVNNCGKGFNHLTLWHSYFLLEPRASTKESRDISRNFTWVCLNDWGLGTTNKDRLVGSHNSMCLYLISPQNQWTRISKL